MAFHRYGSQDLSWENAYLKENILEKQGRQMELIGGIKALLWLLRNILMALEERRQTCQEPLENVHAFNQETIFSRLFLLIIDNWIILFSWYTRRKKKIFPWFLIHALLWLCSYTITFLCKLFAKQVELQSFRDNIHLSWARECICTAIRVADTIEIYRRIQWSKARQRRTQSG